MSEPRPSATIPADGTVASPVYGWVIIFCLALTLYAVTCSRAIQWQDSGHHILRVVTGEVVNPLGLALSHPLHHYLGRAFVYVLPLEPAFAVTLVSALAAAIAVANVYGCTLLLTNHRGIACWAAVGLAVSNVFWHLATVAETYTLVAALLSAECWCLVAFIQTRRRSLLAGLMLFNGLGVANHMLAILTTPIIAGVLVYALRRDWVRWRTVGLSAGCWLLGASPYLYLIAVQAVQAGDLSATVHSALFGKTFVGNVLNASPPWRSLAISGAFTALSFPNLLLPAAVYAIWRGAAADVPLATRRALFSILAILIYFAARYDVVDQYMFFIPSYVVLAICSSIGAAAFLKRSNVRMVTGLAIALLIVTPLLSAGAPSLARRSAFLRRMLHNKPYRDDFVYLLTPWAVVETSADKLSRQAVELAGDRGLVLIEDGMARFAVQYQALRRNLDEVQITTEVVPGSIAEAVRENRPVVLVPLDRDAPRTPAPIGAWRRVGDLYVLDPLHQTRD